MTYPVYFEVSRHWVETQTPFFSSSDPSDVSQIATQPVKAVRNGQAKRTRAASPKTLYQPKYTLGVFQGNPVFWLGSAVLIRSVQMLQPTTMTAF